MTWKLFIDDERFPPENQGGWVIARSSGEAIYFIVKYGWPNRISFDHDLGGSDTAMFVVYWMAEEISSGRYKGSMPEWYVHSQNPIGKKNIEGYLQSLENFMI